MILKHLFLAFLIMATGCSQKINQNSDSAKEEVTTTELTIKHYKYPCVGESIQSCYLIVDDKGETSYFYDEIEGFEYKWGYDYKLKVSLTPIEAVMTDGPNQEVKLLEVLEKKPNSSSFSLPLLLDGTNLVMKDESGDCIYNYEVVIETNKTDCSVKTTAEEASFTVRDGKLVIVE